MTANDNEIGCEVTANGLPGTSVNAPVPEFRVYA